MKERERIEDLERKIAELQEQLRVERKRKESLWNDIYEKFLKEGNSHENSEWWAEEISQLVGVWVGLQRERLSERISSGNSLQMPPYTDCLNDLIVSLSAPGSEPPSFPTPPSSEAEEKNFSVLPINEVPLDEAESLRPKKRKIGVPKPIPGASPLPLPPLSEADLARELAGR